MRYTEDMTFAANPTHLRSAGVSLVEVLVGVSIGALVAVFLVAGVQQYVAVRTVMLAEVQRAYLAEEGYELIRFLRDESWTNVSTLSTGTWYGLALSSGDITSTTTPEVVNGEYHRTFQVAPLYRFADGSVAGTSDPGGATEDTNGRFVTVRVVGSQGTTTMESIVTNIFDI